MALPVPLLPLIKEEFNLSYTQAGLVTSAFSITYGISQLPAGFLADRIGPRTMITLSICGIGLSGLLIGLSNSYFLMIAFLVFMGITGGGYHPSAPPLLAASVPPENRGKAFGFHLIGGNAAFFLAPLIAAGIAAAWGWRGSFIGLAVPTLIFGVIFYLFISRSLKPAATVKQETAQAAEAKSGPPGHLRRLIVFIALETSVAAFSGAVASFLSLFAVDRFGISLAAAAVFLTILYSTGLWASPIGGWLSDRIGWVPALLISCFGTAPVIFLLPVVPYGAAFILTLLVWGALSAIRLPTTESFIIASASPGKRSTIFGIYYFAGSEISGILTPILGYLIDKSSYTTAFSLVGGAILVITVVCAFFLWSSRSRKSAVESTG